MELPGRQDQAPRRLPEVGAAGVAAAVGAVLGAVGFALARPWAARIEIDGHAPFVDDVQVAPVLLVLILLAIPALRPLAITMSSDGEPRMRADTDRPATGPPAEPVLEPDADELVGERA